MLRRVQSRVQRAVSMEEASAGVVVGSRRPARTTDSSQRGNRCINFHQCIIDDISNEITAKQSSLESTIMHTQILSLRVETLNPRHGYDHITLLGERSL